jgi:hypothetical protein
MSEKKKEEVTLTKRQAQEEKMRQNGFPNKCPGLADDPAAGGQAEVAMHGADRSATALGWTIMWDQAYDDNDNPIPGKVQIYSN